MATISCNPSDVARASACYCFNEQVSREVMIYLLAQIAGDTSTPAQLASKAKCYCFSDRKVAESVITMLLCNIANAAGV